MTRAIIEATTDPVYGNWDSDIVGNESYPLNECHEHIEQLRANPEWRGYWFRVMADDGHGYNTELQRFAPQEVDA